MRTISTSERQDPPSCPRQVVVEHVDLDVARCAHAHDRAEEDHHDQAVDGDLLRPGKAVVQHVAGEELQEDAERHAPEDRERHPVLDRVVREIDRRRLLLEGLGHFFGGYRSVVLYWVS